MEWNDAWSDKSNKCTADAKPALKYTDSKDDGIFWMPFWNIFQVLRYNCDQLNQT